MDSLSRLLYVQYTATRGFSISEPSFRRLNPFPVTEKRLFENIWNTWGGGGLYDFHSVRIGDAALGIGDGVKCILPTAAADMGVRRVK